MAETRQAGWMLTTAVAASLLRRDDPRVLRRLTMLAPGDVCISAITRGELELAARMSRAAESDGAALALLLEHVEVLAYSNEAAEHYAGVREAMHWKEVRAEMMEAQVAAHARCLGITLVTDKAREWEKVPGLRVETWSG